MINKNVRKYCSGIRKNTEPTKKNLSSSSLLFIPTPTNSLTRHPYYLEKGEWCRHNLVPRVEWVSVGRPPRHEEVAGQAHRVNVQAAVGLLYTNKSSTIKLWQKDDL